MTKSGVKDATRNTGTIKKWFSKAPEPNIGIRTGRRSNLLVLDIDENRGGAETLKSLMGTLGPLPLTPEVKTGNGRHLYFAYPEFDVRRDTAGKTLGKGIDVLGLDSYIVAPRSTHKSGMPYFFLKDKSLKKIARANLPQKWLHAISMGNGTTLEKMGASEGHADQQQSLTVPVGQRNQELFRLASSMQRRGLPRTTIMAALADFNTMRCLPPLANAELEKIVDSASRYAPLPTTGDRAEGIMHATLSAHFANGDHLLFGADGQFWAFDGHSWQPLMNAVIEQHVLSVIASTGPHKTPSASLMRQTTTLLQAHCAVPGDPLRIMSPPARAINTLSGELWLEDDGTVSLKPHNPKSFLRQVLPVKYDPTAQCPMFDGALREIFAGASDTDQMIRHWWELVGYTISGIRSNAIIPILFGGGANGKSGLVQVIIDLVGQDRVMAKRVEELETNRFVIGSLLGKLMFVDDDMRAGTRLPDGVLKKLSEEKILSGERKNGNIFEFRSVALPFLLCNSPASLADLSYGTERRLMVIPFDQRFEGEAADKTLFARIRDREMSGILNKALAGIKRVIKRGVNFEVPDTITKATKRWIQESNPVPLFVRESCDVGPKFHSYAQDIYDGYVLWSQQAGITMVQQRHTFQRNLATLGYLPGTRGNRGARIAGLKLKSRISSG